MLLGRLYEADPPSGYLLHMEKLLCFIIEGTEIHLDKVLIDFNGIPIFFICTDDSNHFFVVLCTDVDSLEYVVVHQSQDTILKMLTGKISMQTVFLHSPFFWYVRSGETIQEDIVNRCLTEQLDVSFLPTKEAMFEAISVEDRDYITRFSAR